MRNDLLRWVCILMAGCYLVSLATRSGSISPLWDGAFYPAGFAVCAWCCLSRAAQAGIYRRCWQLIGVALLFGAGGWATAGYRLFRHQLQPYPSISDIGWVGLYLLAFVAVLEMIRQLGLTWASLSLLLDSAVAGLGTAAVLAWFEIPRLRLPPASWLTNATTLAYPGSELLILGALVTLLVASGFRVAPMIWVLTGVIVLLAVANCLFEQGIEGGFQEGTWINGGWLAALAIVALYAGTSPAARRQRARPPWLTAAVSAVATLISLTLLVVHGGGHGLRHDVVAPLAVLTIVVAVVRLAVSQREAQVLADSRQLARTDELTELVNRRGFHQRAIRALAAADVPLAIVMIDLDGFKDVNDGLGHPTGDALLGELGRRLAQESHGSNLVARIGGDEFAVLAENADAEAAVAIAQRLREVIRQPFEVQGIALRIDCSIGIASAPTDGVTLEELMRKADIAMYTAKSSQLGVQIYTDDGGIQQNSLRTIAELRDAIEHDPAQLVLHYQPKVRLSDGQLVGVEALLRWQHPERGLLMPGDFLALAAKARLMLVLTDRVIECALRDMSAWTGDLATIPVSINLPPEAVNEPALVDKLAQLLRTTGIPANRIVVEITEDFLVTDIAGARLILDRLRLLGVAVSIDDYGTGYSSLAYLRDLPVDELKLDRTFTSAIGDDPRAAAIVRSTVVLAHSLGLSMVAEGIEDADTWRRLVAMGCDVGQGYYFARPQSTADLPRALTAMRAMLDVADGEVIWPDFAAQ